MNEQIKAVAVYWLEDVEAPWPRTGPLLATEWMTALPARRLWKSVCYASSASEKLMACRA